MAIPFRLPTYHDSRAALLARATQQLAELIDLLQQLEQLPTPPEQQGADWLVEDESEDEQPALVPVNPRLLVDVLRVVRQYEQQDSFDRVAGHFGDAVVALPPLVCCHSDPPHATRAANAPRGAVPFALPVSAATSPCHPQSQPWHQIGADLRRLADRLSTDEKLSLRGPSSAVKGRSLVQTLLASVLPQKLSCTAAVVYIGMRLLRFKLKDF